MRSLLQWSTAVFEPVKVRVCATDGWRLWDNGEQSERLKPVQSIVWTSWAGVQLENGAGQRFWLLSIRAGRSDQLLRRWLQTLPRATAASRHERIGNSAASGVPA